MAASNCITLNGNCLLLRMPGIKQLHMGNNNDPITNIFKKMNETPEQTEDRLAREKANALKWSKLILDEAKEPNSQQASILDRQ
eukprot:14300-Heterococcus_DN1.PRE.1